MKNTLILIFLIPIFLFGQDDCGEQPIAPFAYKAQITADDKQTSIYRKYAKELKKFVDVPYDIFLDYPKGNRPFPSDSKSASFFGKNILDPKSKARQNE